MSNLIKLVKYGILEKKRAYLIFGLVIAGIHLSFILANHYNPVHVPGEASFAISFLVTLVSSILIFIDNIYSMATSDINYLTFSLPIKPSYFYLRRLIIFILEEVCFFFLNSFFLIIVLRRMDPAFNSSFNCYLFEQGGLFTVFLFGIFSIEMFLKASTFVSAGALPSERKGLRYSVYIATFFFLFFSDFIESKLAKIFPYKLPFSIPQYSYEYIKGSWETSLFFHKIEFNLAVISFELLVIVFFFLINVHFFNKEIEVRRNFRD